MNNVLSVFFSYTPLKFYVQSFWRDEAFSYLMAKQNIIGILTMTAKDANPPLYYLLLHVWMLLFGSSEMAIRTVSFLFFLGTLYVIGLFLMEFFKTSTKNTLVYLALFALNPLLHYYAFEGRMYSMFAFFSMLSFYFLYKKNYRFYLLSSILGLYTHYFMFFVLISQVAYIFFINRRLSQNMIALYTKIAVSFLPWLLLVLSSHPPVEAQFWIPKPTLATFLNLPGRVFTGYEDLMGFQYPLLPVVSAFFYIFAFLIAYKTYKHKAVRHHRQNDLGMFLFLWVSVPLILILSVSLVKPVFLPRYTIFITVGFLFLFIYMLQPLDTKIRQVVLVAAFVISIHYGIYQVAMRTKADIRKPLREIKKIMGKDDVVYVTDPYNFHPAEYYINDRVVYIYGRDYKQLPWFIGKVLIPEEKTTTSLPMYPRKSFILNSDNSYIVQALY